MSGESERVEYLLNCWSHLQLAREYEQLENIIKEVREELIVLFGTDDKDINNILEILDKVEESK